MVNNETPFRLSLFLAYLYALDTSCTRLYPQGVCRIRNARSSRTAALPRRCAPRNDTERLPHLSLRDQCAHWSWQSPAVGLFALAISCTRLYQQGVCRIRNARSSRTAALPRRCAPRNDIVGSLYAVGCACTRPIHYSLFTIHHSLSTNRPTQTHALHYKKELFI